MRPVVKDATDQSVVIRIVDSSDGTPETGVVYNTSGIDLWYRREGATKTSITEASLSALNDAHTDGGFLHIGDGYYRLDLPDAAVATGADGVMVGGTVTGMVVVGCYVPLVDVSPYNVNQLPDALLKRDWSSVSGEAARSVLNALRFLRNKWSVASTTLTVTKEDDTTTAWTGTVSTDGSAQPITGNDPS